MSHWSGSTLATTGMLAGIGLWTSPAIANADIGSKNMSCNADGQGTTVETCETALEFYRRDIRSFKASRGVGPDHMSITDYNRLTLDAEKKIQDIQRVLSHMKANRPPVMAPRQRSSYNWPQNHYPNTNPVSIQSNTWSGVMAIGVPSFSVQFDYIFGVSGRITVPEIALPNNATCGSSSFTYQTAQWIGIGGETSAQIQYDPDAGQLVQAGVEQKIVCGQPGYPSGQFLDRVFIEDYVNGQSFPSYVCTVNAGDVVTVKLDTSAMHPNNPYTYFYTISDSSQVGSVCSIPKTPVKITGKLPLWTAEAIVERPCTYNQDGTGSCVPVPQPILPASFPFSNLEYNTVITEPVGNGMVVYNFQDMNIPLVLTNAQPCFSNDDMNGPCVSPAQINMLADSCDELTSNDVGTNGGSVTYAYKMLPNAQTGACDAP